MIFPHVTQTARLTLRCLELRDAPCIFRIRSDPEYAALFGWEPYRFPEEAEGYVQRVRRDPDCYSWAVVVRDTGETAGAVCLWDLHPEEGRGELGYELLPAFRGQGFTEEACRTVLELGFTALALKQLVAYPRPDNLPSVRLLRRLGFAISEAQTRPGDPFDHLVFRLTRGGGG